MRAVIAEDLALLRDGMTRLLHDNEIEVVAAVGDGDALIHAVMQERPDIAIVDIRMPPSFRDEGLRAAITLRERVPETAILIVSQYVEGTYARELLADGRGGVGYLLKDRVMDVDAFVEAVRRVAEGGTALDPEVVAHFVGRKDRLAALTPREHEVLAAARDGGTVAELAGRLFLSPGTVRNYLSAAMQKLGARNRADAVRLAEEKGWL